MNIDLFVLRYIGFRRNDFLEMFKIIGVESME